MNEVSILPPLSLTRFFLAQQLVHKNSKNENHNVTLDTFVSDTSTARNRHLPDLEKKHFSYIRIHIPFLVQISVSVLLKINERLEIRAIS